MELVRNVVRSTRLFNFNSLERDRWVQRQASMVPKGSRVLDVGAGSCPYAKSFAHCDYTAQDFKRLDGPQLRGRAGYGRVHLECDASDIPVPADSFDVVLCTEVIEHVPRPIEVIREIGRVLKPGGKLFLTAPLGSGIHQAPYHFYGGYTPYWYEKFLSEAGFDKFTIEPNGGFFKHYAQESIRFARLTNPAHLSHNILLRLAWLPIWLLLCPWFLLVCPVMCHALDRIDGEKAFTIGYHVTAHKRLS